MPATLPDTGSLAYSPRSASAAAIRPMRQAGYTPANSAAPTANASAWRKMSGSAWSVIVQPNERRLMMKIKTQASTRPVGIARSPAANPISPVSSSTSPRS